VAKVIWSPQALEDIKFIFDFIAKDSLDKAALFIERIIESTDRLQSFPHTGRIISEIGRDECREIIYGSYRIMYEIKNDSIRISAVVHSARNWKPE
jgi:addiction module RelE/StbE family toxin